MKKQNTFYRSLLVMLFAFSFAVAPFLTMTQKTLADGIDLKALNAETEAKALVQYGQLLAQFFNATQEAQKRASVLRADLSKIEGDGQRVKNDVASFRQNLQSLITKLKAANKWDDALDADISTALGGRKVKSFLGQGGGARRLLESALNEINDISADVDGEVRNVRAKPSSAHARAKNGKGRCFGLFTAIAVAELLKMKQTAQNIDAVYDKNCGPGGGSASPAE
jgi:hypothetical protein